ncbi:MAG: hypothetical protein WCV69_03520 [Patescibacteria group bacterium]|jgi:hypothetical protein
MDILTFIFIWPLLIFSVGLIFISFSDVMWSGDLGGVIGMILGNFLWIFLLIWIIRSFTHKKKPAQHTELFQVRNALLIFSISAMFPIFIRYLIDAFENSLLVMIISMVVAYVFTVWGIFMKQRSVIMYSNIFGEH